MDGKRRNKNLTDLAEKEAFAPVNPVNYNYERISLRSLIDAHIHYQGSVSQEWYEWSRAGTIVSVDLRDAPALLARKVGGRGCCGASKNGNQVFETV